MSDQNNNVDFMDITVDDAVELATIPTGGEAQLEIKEVFVNSEKCQVRLRLGIVSPAGSYKDITHFLYYPKGDDDAKKVNNKKLALQRFFKAFNLTAKPSTNDFIGRTGWAILDEKVDPKYGTQNEISNVIIPAAN